MEIRKKKTPYCFTISSYINIHGRARSLIIHSRPCDCAPFAQLQSTCNNSLNHWAHRNGRTHVKAKREERNTGHRQREGGPHSRTEWRLSKAKRTQKGIYIVLSAHTKKCEIQKRQLEHFGHQTIIIIITYK